MSKRKGSKTTGGVTLHALQRIMGQYWISGKGKKEVEAEARRLLRACKMAAGREKNGRILISDDTLEKHGFDKQKFEKLRIPNGKLFAVLQGGEVVNVMQIQQ